MDEQLSFDYKFIDLGGVKDYQNYARETAIYPEQYEWGGMLYTVLGLNGEAGEIAEKFKKLYRDNAFIFDSETVTAHDLPEGFMEEIRKEIGDVCWYLANLCEELQLELSDVLMENLDKLYSRKYRGQLKGSGDNR